MSGSLLCAKELDVFFFCCNYKGVIVLAFFWSGFLLFVMQAMQESERGNNVQMLLHGNTKERETQRKGGEGVEGRPALASSQTDTNRQLQSEDCCLFGEGEKNGRGGVGRGSGEKRGEKFI